MKKLMLLILCTMFGIMAHTADVRTGDFILTKNACYYFEKVHFGFGQFIIGKKENGEKQKFLRCDVLRFRKNGYLYERAPVIENNMKSGKYDFMKVICKRDEMTLYEYKNYRKRGKDKFRYFVFRKERFIIELCSHSDANLLAMFNKMK